MLLVRQAVIISLILGGLGNQCFQYAMGRQLALARGVPFKLARFGYCLPKYAHHPYLLNRFRISAEHARLADYLRLAPTAMRGSAVMRDREQGFDERTLTMGKSTMLVGYWQSPRYFSDIEDTIRRELTLAQPPGVATQQTQARIRSTEAVAVHVRRTDYVDDPRNVALFEPCTLDYYREAIRLVGQQVASAHFFVFSDDPAWTRANLRCDYPMTYVEHNDASRGHEDLMLMRACRHNIIANSTFSWWGAWLNEHPGKIVVAPHKWFRGESRREDDLLPQAWIRL